MGLWRRAAWGVRARSASRAAGLVSLVLLAGSGCAQRAHVSRGTRISEELRGETSAEVVERFTQVARGSALSMVATFVDFAYVRAITRERGRTVESEREAFNRYVRRQATFYVYLTLHELDRCGPAPTRTRRGRGEDGAPEGAGGILDLRTWDFVMQVDGEEEEREAETVTPGPIQLAPTGGCIVQGYVHFGGNVPTAARWMSLAASGGSERGPRAEVRWELEPWTAQGSRPRAEAGRRQPERRSGPRGEAGGRGRDEGSDDDLDGSGEEGEAE